MTMPLPEQSEDGREPGGYEPRDWLTPTQRAASENFTGYPGTRKLSDQIRAREYRDLNGMIRQKGKLTISWDEAKKLLGMGD